MERLAGVSSSGVDAVSEAEHGSLKRRRHDEKAGRERTRTGALLFS